MKYRLNRKSLERAKSFVRSGQYVPGLVTPPVLEDPPNWSDFMQAFLGIRFDKPDDDTETGYEQENAPHVDWYEYPFTDGQQLGEKNLSAIKAKASGAGETDIADAAQTLLDLIAARSADQKVIDKNTPGRDAPARLSSYERDIRWASGSAGVKASGNLAGKKKLPQISGTAYTGVAMELDGFEHPLVIDNTGWDFTDKSRPILKDHAPEKPVGSTTAVQLVGQHVQFDGPANGSGPWRDEVVEAGLSGFPWQVSVGAKVLAAEFLPKGKTAVVNGQTFEGPKIISRKTRLKEISILSLGADDDSAARIAARAKDRKSGRAAGSSDMKKKFAAWLKSKGINPTQAASDDGLLCALKTQYESSMKCKADDEDDEDYDDSDDSGDGTPKPAKSAATTADIHARGKSGEQTPIDIKAMVAEMQKELRGAVAEGKRLAKINKTADEYRGRVDGSKVEEFKAKAVADEITIEGLELELIKAARPDPKNVHFHSGRGGDRSGAIIAAACARSSGVTEKVAYTGLNEQEANIAASTRGMGIHSIIAASAAMLGISCHPGGIDDDFLADFIAKDKALHRQQAASWRAGHPGQSIQAAVSGGGFSTMSLTGITENIMYKAMLAAYTLQASVVPEICAETDTNDFKQFKRYRLSPNNTLQPLGPGGELKVMSLQDESYANQVKTIGALLTLKREDIINDDMGALMQSPQMLGEEAAQSREVAVITTLLTGTSAAATGPSVGKKTLGFDFFSTGAKNLQTGGSSALSNTSLQTALQKFRQQVNANNRPIGVEPDRILIAPANEVNALNLFQGVNLLVQALQLPASGPQSASQIPNVNQFQKRFRPVISPFLASSANSAAGIGNDTQWMLCCNPSGGKAVLQAAYLRGQRTPIIRQVETDAVMLGLAYQAIFDFGIALGDWRMGQWSAGQ